jgi:hypothetical protein
VIKPRGGSLIESLIAILVTGLMVLVLVALVNGVRINRSSLLIAQATSIAQEELEALRDLPYTSLGNQTNAPFLGVLPNFGTGVVQTGGFSSPNRLELTPPSGATSGLTGTLVVPSTPVGDATVSVKVRERAGAAGTWQAGVWLRAVDARNGYLLYIEPTQLKLVKRVSTVSSPFYTDTTLTTYSQTFSPDTWYTLSTVLNGSQLTVSIDGSGLTPVTDGTFTSGAVALYGGNGALAAFDDLSISSPATTWNFDSDTVGTLPGDFVRVGVNDLADTTPTVSGDNGLLTIGDSALKPGDTNIRQLTVTVQWKESTGTKSVTLTSLRAKYGLFL